MGKRSDSILRDAGFRDDAPAALVALVNLACERPGFDPHNYVSPGDRGETLRRGIAAYRSDARRAAKGLRDVTLAVREAFLAGVTDEDLNHSAQGGRVELRLVSACLSAWCAHYHAGQYYPTEYRAAIARVIRDAATHAARRRQTGQ